MHEEFRTEAIRRRASSEVWKRVVDRSCAASSKTCRFAAASRRPLLFLVGCLVLAALGFLIVGPARLRPRAWSSGERCARSSTRWSSCAIARHVFGTAADYEANYRVVAYATRARIRRLMWVPARRRARLALHASSW